MGSDSDLKTLKPAIDILKEFGIKTEVCILSAHRTPIEMMEYAKKAESENIKVIIAGAGGAAHLPGMLASLTSLFSRFLLDFITIHTKLVFLILTN